MVAKAGTEKLSWKAEAKEGSAGARRQEKREENQEKDGIFWTAQEMAVWPPLWQSAVNACVAAAPKTQFKHWSEWVLFYWMIQVLLKQTLRLIY